MPLVEELKQIFVCFQHTVSPKESFGFHSSAASRNPVREYASQRCLLLAPRDLASRIHVRNALKADTAAPTRMTHSGNQCDDRSQSNTTATCSMSIPSLAVRKS